MALIKCPECGKEISSQAPACPHCGYPLIENQHDTIEIHNSTFENLYITTSDNRKYYINYNCGGNNTGYIDVYENGQWIFYCNEVSLFGNTDYEGKYFVVKGKKVKIKVEKKSEGFWHPIYYLDITEIE